jgi:hypothetical protein
MPDERASVELELLAAVREATRALLRDAHAQLRRAVEGADGATLAWRPPVPEPNSISGLVFHVAESERWLLHNALDRVIERDREAQFAREAADPAELVAVLDAADAMADELLDALAPAHLVAIVARETRRTGAAWLLRSVGHAREHAAQALLIRDLADRVPPGGGSTDRAIRPGGGA